MLGLGILYGIRLLLSTYTIILFGYVILSWIAQGNYNPSIMMIQSLLTELARPVLAPVQKLIPPIAGLDLSPILVLITFQALGQSLYTPAFQLAAGYNCALRAIL